MNEDRAGLFLEGAFRDFLENLSRDFGSEMFHVKLSEAQLGRLLDYAFLLERWRGSMNLLGPCDLRGIIRMHILDSLAAWVLLARVSKLEFESVLDIGSGAGLPGVVFASMSEGASVTLLEPRARRVVFLREAKRVLGLANVSVERKKLEGLAGAAPSFDLSLSRAIAIKSEHFSRLEGLLLPGGLAAQMLGGGDERHNEWRKGSSEMEFSASIDYSLWKGGPERRLVLSRCST